MKRYSPVFYILSTMIITHQLSNTPGRTIAWMLRQNSWSHARQTTNPSRPNQAAFHRLYTTTSHDINISPEREELLKNWRSHPSINPTLVFSTLVVPSESLQSFIQQPELQEHLAKPSNWDLLHHIHPRIKMVQTYNDTHKLILLRRDAAMDIESVSGGDTSIQLGPDKEIPITFQQLSFAYILNQLLPVPPPSAYEQIGHVAHFNLKPHHAPYGPLIGEVLRETNPSIDTVVNKVGEVKGKYRTYDLDLLAGPPNFETTVVEHGMQVQLNVAECYWCTRLSGERQELLRDIQKSSRQTQGLVVADVFCGVGAVCLLLAKSFPNATILANDWNERAIEYFDKSIDKNGLRESNSFDLSCGDAYDFLIEMGSLPYAQLPDHILMNYPLEAPTFLGSLRWWSSTRIAEKYDQSRRYPRFHVYTFARSGDNDDVEEVAVDVVANELIPAMDAGPEAESVHRRTELCEEFDAEVSTRLVRDVAPGKVVVCVSFSLTPKLVNYMQGDYI